MANTYPTTLNTHKEDWANSTPVKDTHPEEHNDIAGSTSALEAKVGVNSSAVTTSHDYKLGEVTSTDKAVGKTATQTLTNKTLTSPIIAVIDNSGDLTLPTGAETLVGRATTDTLTNKTINPAAGSNTIDGDKLEIDWTPSNFTPTDVTETDDAGQLSAYLKGVDSALGAVSVGAIETYLPVAPVGATVSSESINTNTTAHVSLFNLPQKITVNKLSIVASAAGTAGTLDIGVFSEDGQTQEISITTASISGSSTITTAVSAVELSAGNHWIVILPNGAADVTLRTFVASSVLHDLLDNITSEPDIGGRLTVTASTMPATITPANIDGSTANDIHIFRLDN